MSIIKVNQDKCTKCGTCCEVCPTKVIECKEHGPEMTCVERCIACGQCVAVCPQDALDNEKNLFEKQVPLEKFPVLDAHTAEHFMRSRRSVRCYKKDKVDHNTLLKLLDLARFAPTAANTQGISYIVVENAEIMKRITKVTIDWMEEMYLSGDKLAQRYERYVRLYRETGRDVILRDAPNLVVALAADDFPYKRDNTCFCLAYLELYATSLGLGSCWMGYVERCGMSKYQPLMELLQVPQGMVVTGAVVVGYPKYKMKRLVDRNPLNVIWVRE